MDKCMITNPSTALFIYLQIPTNYMTGVVNKLDYKHLSTTLLYIYHTDKLHDRSLEKEGK